MRRSAIASLAAAALLLSPWAAFDASAVGNEPSTSTIRIRLKGPTLRVRCRGGDCDVSVVRAGSAYTVSITRTRNGVPFTFTRTVENPTNLAIETGLGDDVVSVVGADVPGFFRVYTADGDDALTIVDTSARGKVAIDGGKGNDTIALSPGIFTGKFRLHGRAGDDTVTVTGGRFESRAGFAGGAGTDSFAAPTAHFAEPPIVDGFEP